ncbi:hypothetical protein SAMN06272737_1526 [Blastococcus mobilis]|uniref:Uncharacterized protein n=1 Tax=Blastococcus mobilis TaxID=1938746 RepID=A0A239AQZ9_9ACTN|nr:hypothetical protein SAMN06272737_1526 [Blastococcus mobilis]
MSRMLRSDFATASVGLVGNAHRNNLGRLHDWLIDEVGLLPHATVLGVANYRQGSFGRLPNHMLLVTDEWGLLQVRLTTVGTDHAATAAWLVKASSYSTGVSLPSARCWRRRL